MILFVTFAVAISLMTMSEQGRTTLGYIRLKLRGGCTVEERLAQYSAVVETRLRAAFQHAGLSYPPSELSFVVFKDTRRLEVYARELTADSWRLVTVYEILGLSGKAGPKLRDGDNQVPEGLYLAESLNPNSRFHLSVRLNYPNATDRQRAKADGRVAPGGDIMIHGSTASIGCLAMGDQPAEDLFVLAALTAKKPVRILISPTDFRLPTAEAPSVSVAWGPDLYHELRNELAQYSH